MSDPSAIRQVFSGSAAVFRAGDANRAIEVLLGPNAPMMIDGERHVWMRRLVQSRMRGAHLEPYGQLVVDAVAAELARWPLGRPFALLPRMQRVVADVVIGLVFGDAEAGRRERLRRAVLRIARLGEHRATLLPWLRLDLGRLSPWGLFLSLLRELDSAISEEIAARRAGAAGDDLLGALVAARDGEGLPLADAEVRDQVANLLFAGYETSVVTLCWCFDLVLRHPEAVERVRSGDGAYLEAAVKEVLRVRTVIYAVGRRLAAPATVGPYLLPAGTVVAANIAQVHRSARLHPAPDEFRPERFLGAAAEPNAWIPFGGGPHKCPGAAFATFEMQTVLRAVLARADLRPASRRPDRVLLRAVSAAPARGVRVVMERRRP